MDEKNEYTVAGLVLDSARKIRRALGRAFPLEAYRGALFADLRAQGLKVREHAPVEQTESFDAVVESRVVVEVEAVQHLSLARKDEALDRLFESQLPFGLLINFGHRGPGDEPEYVSTVVDGFDDGFEDWLDGEDEEEDEEEEEEETRAT